jgi:glutathione S-transferase
VNYWLLIKGLVSSPADLLQGKTTDPNLSIVRLSLNLPSGGWKSNPENDPLPASISTSSPCLRIRDAKTGVERWVRESSSIVAYLEEVYADRGPSLKSNDLLDTALTNDLVGQMDLSVIESLTYVRHASPQLAAFAGLKDEERSRAAARIGYQSMVKGFMKVQEWAGESLSATGWLTPGADGPGLVDINFAAVRRYLQLVYGWNVFEKEELAPLEEWYGRFQKLSWWDAFEGRPDCHPSELKFSIDWVQPS